MINQCHGTKYTQAYGWNPSPVPPAHLANSRHPPLIHKRVLQQSPSMIADHVPTVVVSSTFHIHAKKLRFPFATLDRFLFQHPELLVTKEDLATISHQPQPPARNPEGAGNSTTRAHVSLAFNANIFTNADSVVASTQQSGAGMGHPINTYTITTPL